MWDARQSVSSRSKAGDPLIRDTTAWTRSTPAHPRFPASRGVPGEAGGFCTLEPAPRRSGAWKGRRGRCSDCAASSGSGDELFAEPAAQCTQAISGRALVEKSHLEKGGSGAASLGAAGPAPGSGGFRRLRCTGKMWSLPSVPSCSIPHGHIDQLDVRGCFAPPNSESVKPRGFIPAHALSHGCFQPGEVPSFPATELRPGDAVRPSPSPAVGDRKPGVKGLSPTPAPGMGVPSETLLLKKRG